MKFRPPKPLTRVGRVLRSILVLGVLVGSLLPDVGGVSLSLAFSVLAAPVIVYEVLRFFPRLHPALIIVPLFVLFALHAIYIPPTSDYGDEKLSRWLTSTLVSALCAVLLRDRRTLYTFAKLWVGVAFVLAVLASVGYGGGRATLFDSNPIWFGRVIAVGVVIAIWLWWNRAAPAWLMIFSLIVLAMGLIVAGSRGPVLASVVGVVALTLLVGTGRWWRAVLVVCGGILGIVIVQTLPIFQKSRFASLLEQEDTGTLRDVYFGLTLPIIAEHPDGVGFGNWGPYAGNPIHRWPHNLFIEVFAELGVAPGALLLLVLAIILIALAAKARRNPTTLLVAALLVVETVHVTVSGDLNARTFWFLLTLGIIYVTGGVVDAPPPVKPNAKKAPLRADVAS